MENDEPKMKNEKKKKEINSCGFMKLAKNPCGERESENNDDFKMLLCV